MEGNAVYFSDFIPDLCRHGINFWQDGAIRLLYDDRAFLSCNGDGKSGSATRTQRRADAFDSAFYILRIIVHSPDDNQIFQTSRNE